ncbi:F0F1 ATP synthase subunit A [Paenibacillus mucilaginosus]|uniref:ATP synthase subunit a n=2 Tax=Paenibacillus mucilaginosus TaxID=61624 RepID=H6NT21_9BACL|nr:F0F1 ATP synthase subunit A [Paenibacillus mucilaginosus]AEI38699.1 ATP synthase F0, A subunit [Paenibacillus mucilaginosus KNP414]AFC27034.1 ATP synthase F0, A subunit [Paenibacillus mucilaginosus 3016]MCG7215837.1 F0F1 ATP synthase subunit A [Paenibacillus mucilaginosus]WDM27786.1 F0F1 ATP synthase subunit A [Paenibacillus mucilaginosus]WFA15971.1 ATP synthase F0 subunit A [Paenibacillus mucilaginosus]
MHELPIVNWLGLNWDLSTIITVTVTCLIVLILAIAGTRNLSVHNPGKMQNFLEWLVEFVQNIIAGSMDMKKGKPFLMLGITLIMFIFVGNMLGLPLYIATEVTGPLPQFGITAAEYEAAHAANKHLSISWWKSPTADLSVTMGLALMVIVMVHFLGLTKNTKHYLHHYVEPFAVMFPLNIVKEVSKLLTLGMRLFGNIYAGEVLIAVILMAGIGGIVPLIIWQGFSVFVGAIQAFVFTTLTMVYISQAIVHEEKH